MLCIDVDTGGTMTDTLVSGGAAPLLIKVESTPHDVTVSFMQSLEAAAAAAGFRDLTSFLDEVRLIRWTSTLTSNVLAQRKGPKLGLIVSPGYEDSLYADDPQATAAVMPSLIKREFVSSLPDSAGRAEIVATGSIHVYGALRGRAIAGWNGNAEARIFCRQINRDVKRVVKLPQNRFVCTRKRIATVFAQIPACATGGAGPANQQNDGT